MTATIENLPTEEEGAAFTDLVHRLNRQSVEKHFDAYVDVPWDDPEFLIDPTDPRWELEELDPLGGTEWYRSQPQEARARMGLERVAKMMKLGLEFENVLQRGLLLWAVRRPNGDPTFRYAYHEVIEEAHHTLMFQEFVNRTDMNPKGIPLRMRPGTAFVVQLATWFPQLFFLFVLGGEDPIDHVQRKTLRSGRELHPLIERIMRIHVTEEARHLSFARHYLKTTVPKLSRFKRFRLAVAAPFILGSMGPLMLRPSRSFAKRHNIPREVLREAYKSTPENRARMAEPVQKVRKLCEELGLITPLTRPLWKAFRLA
jgi:hypothetical protein